MLVSKSLHPDSQVERLRKQDCACHGFLKPRSPPPVTASSNKALPTTNNATLTNSAASYRPSIQTSESIGAIPGEPLLDTP